MNHPACVVIVIMSFLVITACSNQEPAKQDKYTTATPKAEDAKILFVSQCAACHGNNGKAGIAGAANLQASQLDSAAIFQTIKYGRGNMPAYKEKMAEQEIKQLTIYVNHLKTK